MPVPSTTWTCRPIQRCSSEPPASRAWAVCSTAFWSPSAASPTNLKIAHALGCSNLTVGKWRRRSHALGFAGLQEAPRPGRPKTIASPTRVQVISVASPLPQDQNRTVTRWTLSEIVATLTDTFELDEISRASVCRILQEVDLKPHQSEYWLNSHDADFDAKAHAICH